jgi:uncharacterized protein YegL
MKRYNAASGVKSLPNGVHVIFCLDVSGSMSGSPWHELISAFGAFWAQTAADLGPQMFASVVQFGSQARITHQLVRIEGQAPALSPKWSGTSFLPPVQAARKLIDNVAGPKHDYTTVVVFMSDGAAGDAHDAAKGLAEVAQTYPEHFQSYTVGFGAGAPRTLEGMAFSNGEQDKTKYRAAALGEDLVRAFEDVAKSISPGRLVG